MAVKTYMYPKNETVTFSVALESISKTNYFVIVTELALNMGSTLS